MISKTEIREEKERIISEFIQNSQMKIVLDHLVYLYIQMTG